MSVRRVVVSTGSHEVHRLAEPGGGRHPGGGAPGSRSDVRGRVPRLPKHGVVAEFGLLHSSRKREWAVIPSTAGSNPARSAKVAIAWAVRVQPEGSKRHGSQVPPSRDVEGAHGPLLLPGGASREVATAAVLKTDRVSNPVGVRPSSPPQCDATLAPGTIREASPCPFGEIGRRAGFRCQCPQGRGGSSPLTGTTETASRRGRGVRSDERSFASPTRNSAPDLSSSEGDARALVP